MNQLTNAVSSAAGSLRSGLPTAPHSPQLQAIYNSTIDYAKDTAPFVYNAAKTCSTSALGYAYSNPIRVVGGTLITGVAAAVGPFSLLAGPAQVLGFGIGGVAAGSTAASIQSAVYGGVVGKGSIFAGAQSLGATATWASTWLPSVGAVMAAVPAMGWKGGATSE